MIDSYIAESLAVSYGAEDFTRPHELERGLNKHYPGELPEDRRAAAVTAMRRLIKTGMLEIHGSEAMQPHENPLQESEALALLEEPRFWASRSESRNAPSYWFSTTKKGKAALHERRYESL
jgi:hypothetical protein